MVLHDINQAIYFSDRLVGLKDGQVVVEGAPQEVITPDSIEDLYGIRLRVAEVEGQKMVMTV
jgi:iron complex transport system ATP-binding protein